MMIEGHDLSHYNSTVGFDLIPETQRFVIHKASEGISLHDPELNWMRARSVSAGRLVMLYHFFRPRQDPLRQAAFLVDHIDPFTLGPLWNDVEVLDGVPATEMADLIWAFNVEAERLSGLRAGVYSSPGFWNSYVVRRQNTLWTRFALWAAHHQKFPYLWPTRPAPINGWGTHFDFWQHQVRPMWGDNDIDLDLFNGTWEELVNMTNAGALPEPPAAPPTIVFPTQVRFRVLSPSGLRVRRGPGTTYVTTETMPYNTIFEAKRETTVNGNIWLEIGYNQYAARYYNGQYLADLYPGE